jgi:hypothetical protein
MKEIIFFENTIYDIINESNYFCCLDNNTKAIVADNTNNIERWIYYKKLNYESINPLNLENRYDPIKAKVNKTAHFDSNTTSLRNFLYEMDDPPLEEQEKYESKLIEEKIINRAVFSGSKSIHFRITIDREVKGVDIYKIIWSYLNAKYFDDKADTSCKNPSRLTRRPGYLNQKTNRKQELRFSGNIILPAKTFIDDIKEILKREEREREIQQALREENEKEREIQRTLRAMEGNNTYYNKDDYNYRKYVDKIFEDYENVIGARHELLCSIRGLCEKNGFPVEKTLYYANNKFIEPYTDDYMKTHFYIDKDIYDSIVNE